MKMTIRTAGMVPPEWEVPLPRRLPPRAVHGHRHRASGRRRMQPRHRVWHVLPRKQRASLCLHLHLHLFQGTRKGVQVVVPALRERKAMAMAVGGGYSVSLGGCLAEDLELQIRAPVPSGHHRLLRVRQTRGRHWVRWNTRRRCVPGTYRRTFANLRASARCSVSGHTAGTRNRYGAASGLRMVVSLRRRVVGKTAVRSGSGT